MSYPVACSIAFITLASARSLALSIATTITLAPSRKHTMPKVLNNMKMKMASSLYLEFHPSV